MEKASDSSYYYTADDVARLTGKSKRYAYRMIAELNDELKKEGFITVNGKIPKKRLHERLGLE